MAIDAIIAQKNSGIKCVYVAIGQKQSTIANVVRKLEETGAMAYTTVVAAAAADPAACEKNYIAALNFYNRQQYTFINLGDSEELWKFNITEVLKHNENSFAAEAQFHPGRYFKAFGNHDILWKSPLDVNLFLNKKFPKPFVVHEGILLKVINTTNTISILLTHGHQGDKMSSGNAFSAWVVAHYQTVKKKFCMHLCKSVCNK